ncbi:MAG TPA: NAD(P)H-dependent oxidoreductase [Candidatus Bathyarchaeia archaeon]|nr:NAD(P)H-dependent oxidoreductase [Candidatus Bathyarchaeia archaeon]
MALERVRILGISGGGRKKSYNTALLQTATGLIGDDASVEIFDVSKFPLYNQDLEHDPPENVKEFKKKIRGSDAILFSTPEFNYSIPAILKNAIEWGNRPPNDRSWDGKPAAIMSASTGLRGGARAQTHLRTIMVDLNMHPVNRPLLLVANAQEKFDANLQLVDKETRETVRSLLASLVEWTRQLQK